ncbi:MAG: crossover junction endodeoxyribonuclease RuvC [Alphaproteobacteria bacterium CG_4_10_14_0_8_um_filter_53_9]|nr:MAG: crossover junction endodeoxyribonuclease RuvC [Alphaproteobacteria bacterium CG_4_10_14_0_8_um_filter_53_9]
MRILGLDPGLHHTGWGVIISKGNSVSYVASGVIKTDPKLPNPTRLVLIAEALEHLVAEHKPDHAAVEEVIVNTNARTSLTLGQARGVCLLIPAKSGLHVAEYAARLVKKSIVGNGSAEKEQVAHMVKILLPLSNCTRHDESDALAVALTHAHHAKFPTAR